MGEMSTCQASREMRPETGKMQARVSVTGNSCEFLISWLFFLLIHSPDTYSPHPPPHKALCTAMNTLVSEDKRLHCAVSLALALKGISAPSGASNRGPKGSGFVWDSTGLRLVSVSHCVTPTQEMAYPSQVSQEQKYCYLVVGAKYSGLRDIAILTAALLTG